MTDTTYLVGLLVAAVALLAVGMAMLHMRLSTLDRRLDGLSRAEAKIDALLKGEGFAFDPYRVQSIVGGRAWRQATTMTHHDESDRLTE